MEPLRQLARVLSAVLHRRRFEQELDEEMRLHLELQAEEYVRRGLSPEQARRRAAREFGQVARYKDEVRDARGLTLFDDGRTDVRFALRTFRRSPGFVAVAVLCLALGIGANALVFSVVNGVLLRPLPYPAPERLVGVEEGLRGGGSQVAWATFFAWRQQVPAFAQVTAFREGGVSLEGPDGAERLVAVRGAVDFFSVHGVPPLLGRTFGAGEHAPGKGAVVVLSEGLWRRRLGADPAVLGRSLTLDGVPHTVAGVMPASFDAQTDVWLPLAAPPDWAEQGRNTVLNVRARLAAGATLQEANAQLAEVAARLEQQDPQAHRGRTARAERLSERQARTWRAPLQVLLGAVALVLLIACANVANLLLARAGARQQELAVRVALGAGRGRLVRQLLVESLLLALAGGVLGALLARWGLDALLPLIPAGMPRREGVTLDGTVLLFLLAVTGASGLGFGLAPALQASRLDVRGGLAAVGARGAAGSGRRLRAALVVGEIALSLVLLVGAGLLGRAFLHLLGTSPGLTADHVLTVHLAIPKERFQDGELPRRLLEPLLQEVRALPGVRSAGLTSLLPIQRAYSRLRYAVEGEPPPAAGEEPWAERRSSSPGYFATLGIPLLAGRDFTPPDAGPDAPPVLIVNEALARRHFGSGSALGRQLRVAGAPRTIVGVVGDVRQAGLDREPFPELHVPYGRPWGDDSLVLVVRTGAAPEGLVPAVREAVRRVDSRLPVFRAFTMEQVLSESLGQRRLVLWLLGVFAGMALVLSAAGLYGVLSFLVAQRTRELGIRMALGASPQDVLRLVLGQGAALAAGGLALGLAGALALSRVLESQLVGVPASDLLTYGAVAALLAGVALLACWVPARRATRVDPLWAIRSEG